MSLSIEERAQAMTGCVQEWYAGMAWCSAHGDEDGNPMWDRCRWVPVFEALRDARQEATDRLVALFDDVRDLHTYRFERDGMWLVDQNAALGKISRAVADASGAGL